MTFKELYESEKAKQAPSKVFVRRCAMATRSSEQTVRSWLCGSRNPDALAKAAIAMEFGMDVEELFPEERRIDHDPYPEE